MIVTWGSLVIVSVRFKVTDVSTLSRKTAETRDTWGFPRDRHAGVSYLCADQGEQRPAHTHAQTDRQAGRQTDRQTDSTRAHTWCVRMWLLAQIGAGGGSGLAGESQWRDNMAWLSQTKGRGRGGRRIGVSKGGGPCQGGGRGKGAVILSHAYISDYC